MQIIYKVQDGDHIAYNIPLEKDYFRQAGFSEEVFEQELMKYKWQLVRSKRDKLIQQTDWTQIPDAAISESVKKSFQLYRQLLRDITDTFADPDTIIWPEKP